MTVWQLQKVLITVTALLAAPMAAMAQDTPSAASSDNGTVAETNMVAPSRFGQAPVDEAYGAFQRGLYITARNLALPRAENGDAAAQTLLAEIHARGLGVPINMQEAAKWYALAAEQNVREAQYQYGMLLSRTGEGDEAIERGMAFVKAAADNGHARAQFNYAQFVLNGRPTTNGREEAFTYFSRAADQGIADAQFVVAQYYLTGGSAVQVNEKKARDLLQKAAAQGFLSAQFEYGMLLVDGIGGPRDVARGSGWILQAARVGSAPAQSAIAQLYRLGIGVEPNNIEAAAWYVVARRAGERVAVMDDFWLGLSSETQREAIARANLLFS